MVEEIFKVVGHALVEIIALIIEDKTQKSQSFSTILRFTITTITYADRQLKEENTMSGFVTNLKYCRKCKRYYDANATLNRLGCPYCRQKALMKFIDKKRK